MGPTLNTAAAMDGYTLSDRGTWLSFKNKQNLKIIVEGDRRLFNEPWADTGTSTGRLMLAVLGGLADVERDLIRMRTGEGQSRAQKRGQQMGRPPKRTDAQKAEARRRRAQGAALAGSNRRPDNAFMTDFVEQKRAALAKHLRGHIQGEIRFDPTSRRLYSTDASIYQIEPLGVVLPKTV